MQYQKKTVWTLCSSCKFPVPKGITSECNKCVSIKDGTNIKCKCGYMRNSDIDPSDCIYCIKLGKYGCKARTEKQKIALENMVICSGICKRFVSKSQQLSQQLSPCVFCQAITNFENDKMNENLQKQVSFTDNKSDFISSLVTNKINQLTSSLGDVSSDNVSEGKSVNVSKGKSNKSSKRAWAKKMLPSDPAADSD